MSELSTRIPLFYEHQYEVNSSDLSIVKLNSKQKTNGRYPRVGRYVLYCSRLYGLPWLIKRKRAACPDSPGHAYFGVKLTYIISICISLTPTNHFSRTQKSLIIFWLSNMKCVAPEIKYFWRVMYLLFACLQSWKTNWFYKFVVCNRTF